MSLKLKAIVMPAVDTGLCHDFWCFPITTDTARTSESALSNISPMSQPIDRFY